MRWAAAWVILAGVPVPGQVQVTPPEVVLGSGQVCAFQAVLAMAPGADPSRPPSWARGSADPSLWLWTVPDGGPGTVDAKGVFTAPAEGPPSRTRVRATLAASPDVWGEAVVTALALPDVPVALVGQVLGPDWATPQTAALPFSERNHEWNPAIVGRRPRQAPPLEVGFGLPAQLAWTLQPRAAGARLTYREGAQTVHRDVSGQDRAVVTLRGWTRRCRVESLLPVGPGTWFSCVETRTLHPRGLFPFPRRGAEGRTPAISCGAPSCMVESNVLTHPRASILIADEGEHVVHRLARDGTILAWCGEPGRPGHLDSPRRKGCLGRLADFLTGTREPPVRFNRPTFLVQGRERGWGPSWLTMVADTGNHVIRIVTPDGRVSTLAGMPGQVGHLDANDPGDARFNHPLGLAWDEWDNALFVADQGNAVVRRISHWGGVATVAGLTGQPGSRDGGRQVAQFTRIKGLALSPRAGAQSRLFVLDGHAVREVNPRTGRVTTVLGQVDTPGFREFGPGAGPRLEPCLNDPWDLKPCGRGFLIADRGNNAVRLWDIARSSLTTLAGDPALASTRAGLLRDGMPVPLDEAYATLQAPRALLPLTPSRVLVGTARTVAILGLGDPAQDPGWKVTLECAVEPHGGSCQVRFALVGEPEAPVPMAYTVDFLEPDGTLAERRSGDSFTWQPVKAEGIFAQMGAGTVVVRCVTHQGRSAGAKAEVEIR